MTWIRHHFFSCTVIVLFAFVAFVSYIRFMVLNDYVVAYEGDCDPYTQNCFVGCEDDECTEEYYYTTIQKYAPNIEAQCGTDITDCDAAYECLPEDGDRCEITYCDPAVDGEDTCETLTEEDSLEEESEEEAGGIEEDTTDLEASEESESINEEDGDLTGDIESEELPVEEIETP